MSPSKDAGLKARILHPDGPGFLYLVAVINLPSCLGHVTLRSKPFGADFFKLSQWSQNRGPLQRAEGSALPED